MVRPSIPDDVIKEIMSRCPAKSVIRFRCVSKSWQRMLSDPLFINLHLRRSIEHGSRRIILVSESGRGTPYSIDAENPGSDNVVPVHIRYPPPFQHFRYDIGCCHGLVCTQLNMHAGCFDMWNPSTGKEMRFPYQEIMPVHQRRRRVLNFQDSPGYGFFYDPSCCTYKLLRVEKREGCHLTKVTVYSMDGVGKALGDVPYHIVRKRAGLADPNTGAVYWLAYNISNELVIVAFNPVSEEFEEIPMPDIEQDGLGDLTITHLRGSLSITFAYKNKFEVWLMGERQSWSRCFVVTRSEGLVTRRFPFTGIPLHITEKGDLVLQMDYNKLYVYKVKQKRLERVEIKYPKPDVYLLANASNPRFWALTPIESLVDIGDGRRKEITQVQEAKRSVSFV